MRKTFLALRCQTIGDGLMALFGMPGNMNDYRTQAVLTASEMVNMLEGLNQEQVAEHKAPINIGIGIASGTVMVGYAGTQHRATYTCVGNTVNLAARIESHTKIVGCPILIDAETRASLSESMCVNSLGEVVFKGKSIPVQIYSVRTE